MVDLVGAHDPLTSSQYLALYQVCKALNLHVSSEPDFYCMTRTQQDKHLTSEIGCWLERPGHLILSIVIKPFYINVAINDAHTTVSILSFLKEIIVNLSYL